MAMQVSALLHWDAWGAQVLRHTPGGAVPAHTLPGAHSTVVLQAVPVALVPAGQTQPMPLGVT